MSFILPTKTFEQQHAFPVSTKMDRYNGLLGNTKATLHDNSSTQKLKDLRGSMELDDLGKVQPLDRVRQRKIAQDDNALQQIGAFNGNRHWNRQLVEFLDHLEPQEVHEFVQRFPKGASTWTEKKKRKRSAEIEMKKTVKEKNICTCFRGKML